MEGRRRNLVTEIAEVALADLEGVRCVPREHSGVGALVLAGSSGRVDIDRARVLAGAGVRAESIRWFGGPGQHEGPWEIDLELFLDRVVQLSGECDRVVVLGTSFGAEAALLTGALSDRVDAVVAFAPSDVVWAGVTAEGRVTSHWSHRGRPIPFVPFDETWEPQDDPPAYVDLYRRSYLRVPEAARAATIPVERIRRLLLVAGGDDRVWPSTEHADRIRVRRAALGLETTLVADPDAGHRTVLPGEPVVASGMRMQRGGSDVADRRLGLAAWDAIEALLA